MNLYDVGSVYDVNSGHMLMSFGRVSTNICSMCKNGPDVTSMTSIVGMSEQNTNINMYVISLQLWSIDEL